MKKNVLIYFFGKTIPALVTLAIIVLGVRFLGEEQYGRYSLIFSGTVLITSFSVTWIQQSMVRFLTGYKENLSEPISRFFFLTLCSALMGILILLSVCIFYFKLNLAETACVVFYTLLSMFFLFRLTLYQTLMKPLKYAIYEGIYNFFLILFFLGFIYILVYRSFLILFISMGLGLLLAEILHRLFLIEKEHQFDLRKIHWDRGFTKKAMDYGFVLTIWIFIYTVTSIADRYFIKEFQDYSAVGAYSAIKDLATKISSFAILPFFLAFNAKINDAWNSGNEQKALSLRRQVLKIELVVCIIVIAGFILFRNLLFTRILHLKGDGFVLSSLFLIAGAFLWQGALFLHKPLELLMKQRSMVYAILCSLAINAIANLIFIPIYGFPAAAVASFFTAFSYVVLVIILSKRYMRNHDLKRHPMIDANEESFLTP